MYDKDELRRKEAQKVMRHLSALVRSLKWAASTRAICSACVLALLSLGIHRDCLAQKTLASSGKATVSGLVGQSLDAYLEGAYQGAAKGVP